MVKSLSEYKFDLFTNYVRTQYKNIDLDEMLSYLKRYSNTVKVNVNDSTNNKNNDDLRIISLKPSQYKKLNAGLGVIIENGTIVNNIGSEAIDTYNNIIESCGKIPRKHNTKYLVLHKAFYDTYERKSSLRTLHVTVSHVVNPKGKSRVLLAAYPEPLQSAVDIVNNAVQEKTELLKNNEYYKLVDKAKINDERNITIDLSDFTSSILKMYPHLDPQSLNGQLRSIIIGMKVNKIVKHNINSIVHCDTYDIGSYKNIIRTLGSTKGKAILNDDTIYINNHEFDMRVKSIDPNTLDHLVQLFITGSTSLDPTCDTHHGNFSFNVRVFSTSTDQNNSNNNNINKNSKKDFFSGLFEPSTTYIPMSSIPIVTGPPYTAQQGGAAFCGGMNEGMGTANSTDPCEKPIGWQSKLLCAIGGIIGDAGSGAE
jgi:hypothetical protein